MKKFSLLIITALFILGGCALSTPTVKEGTIPVAVSFYPEHFIVSHIGGEHVSVHSVIPMGVEPHEFEPKPSDLAYVTNAKLFVYHGAGLDLWASRLAQELDPAQVKILNVSQGINLLQGDAHFWLDPTLMQKIADHVSDALIEVDPAHREEYEKNARILSEKLQALHDEFVVGLSSCGLQEVVTSHSAFAYLANRYGFTQLPISGFSPNTEPSVRDMQNLITLAKEKKIRYVTFETLASARISQTIADEVGAQSLVLNPIEGLTPTDVETNQDYFSLMRTNLESLKTAMECK